MMKHHILLLATSAVFALSACSPDPCKDVNCLNEGICVEGDCVCPPGFEGTDCGTEQRMAFVGNYSVVDDCNLGSFTYEITISATADAGTEVTIHNLGDFDFSITGVVSGNTITITDQNGTGSTVNGSGTLSNGVLQLDYTLVTTSGQTLSCNMTGNIIE